MQFDLKELGIRVASPRKAITCLRSWWLTGLGCATLQRGLVAARSPAGRKAGESGEPGPLGGTGSAAETRGPNTPWLGREGGLLLRPVSSPAVCGLGWGWLGDHLGAWLLQALAGGG